VQEVGLEVGEEVEQEVGLEVEMVVQAGAEEQVVLGVAGPEEAMEVRVAAQEVGEAQAGQVVLEVVVLEVVVTAALGVKGTQSESVSA
jgi:hypothetical protein